jgi:hypothetical protein
MLLEHPAGADRTPQHDTRLRHGRGDDVRIVAFLRRAKVTKAKAPGMYGDGGGLYLQVAGGNRLVGTMGLVRPTWWYSDETFLTDRWNCCAEPEKHGGAAFALDAEAKAIAQGAGLMFIVDDRALRLNCAFAPARKYSRSKPEGLDAAG